MSELEYIHKCIEKLNVVKDILQENHNEDTISKAIDQLNIVQANIASIIPNLIMLTSDREQKRGKQRHIDNCRKCALIYKLVQEGLSNQQIGERLNVSRSRIVQLRKVIPDLIEDPLFQEYFGGKKNV